MNYYFIQINQGYGLLFSRQIVVLPATGAWIYGGSVLAPEVKHSVSLNPLTFTGGATIHMEKYTGCWFGTFFIFQKISWDDDPICRTHIFQRGRYTTSQYWFRDIL